MAETKRMRYFHELNSAEQAEKIAQARAVLGLDPAARVQEMGQAHDRYGWTSDEAPHGCGSDL